MTLIRRFDSIIEPHKGKMLEYKKMAEDSVSKDYSNEL